MDKDFGVLTILLLPGFWSFWIYQSFATADLEGRSWGTKLFLGLGFGVVNVLIMYGLLNLWVYFFPRIIWLGEVRLDLFFAKLSTGNGLFTHEFLVFFTMLAIGSVFLGGFMIRMSICGWLPTQWLPNLFLKKGVGYNTTLNEQALEHIDREYLKGRSSLVVVYPLADPTKKKIGLFGGGMGKKKEICIKNTNDYQQDDKSLQQSESYSIVDLGCGTVIDFFPIDDEKNEESKFSEGRT